MLRLARGRAADGLPEEWKGRSTGRALLLLVPLPVCPSSDELVSQRRGAYLTRHRAAFSRACSLGNEEETVLEA